MFCEDKRLTRIALLISSFIHLFFQTAVPPLAAITTQTVKRTSLKSNHNNIRSVYIVVVPQLRLTPTLARVTDRKWSLARLAEQEVYI